MSRHRIWTLILAIVSLILISVPASQETQAAATASATASKVPSSGIGLAANLPAKGVKVLRNSTYYERALKSTLWDPTPDGMIYHSCMYYVPSGSYVDSIHRRIILPDGKILPKKRCPYPRLTPPNASPAAKPAAAPGNVLSVSGSGNTPYWVDGFEADQLPHLYYLSASLAAPYPPNQPNNPTKSLWEYQWTALGSLSAGSLLQPAVGWGELYSNNTNRSNAPLKGDTEMAAYYLWGVDSAVAGTFYSVKPLDTLHVSIQGYNCGSGGGDCTWWMQIIDQNDGQDSQLIVGSSPVYTSVIGELESNVGSLSNTNCQSLFANHHLVWRHLLVEDQTGQNVTPSTTTYYQTGWYDKNGGPGQKVFNDSSMNADWNTTNGETAADVTWNSTCPDFSSSG